jgi:hypothetical protein
MKKLYVFISVAALLAFLLAGALPASIASAGLSGKVLETMNSGGYTYALIATGNTKTWVAVPETKIVKGQNVTFNPGMVMQNFESKTLKRKFDTIVFSDGVAEGSVAPGGGPAAVKKAVVPAGKVKVAKATGPGAYTVAEVFSNAGRLDKKLVHVRGKVVKVSSGIMRRNWIHLQDGTGDQKEGTYDLVVTSKEIAKVGDIVIASGKIAKDRDFGSNYKYKVLMEDATLKK